MASLYNWDEDAGLIFEDEFADPIVGELQLRQLVCWKDENDSTVHCLGFISGLPPNSVFVQTTEIISVHPTKGDTSGAFGITHLVHHRDLFTCPQRYVSQVKYLVNSASREPSAA